MNTCGTCKHWGKDRLPYFPGLHPCRAVIAQHDVEKVSDDNGFDVEPPDGCYLAKGGTPKAVAVDGSGYFAALKTREDFGCVLWEAKS